MHRDEAAHPPARVCHVGSTILRYHLSAIDDLHAWLRARGDWTPDDARDDSVRAI